MTKIFGNWKEVADGAWRKLIPAKKSKAVATAERASDVLPEFPEALLPAAPEAKAESPVNIVELQNTVTNLKAQLAAKTEEYSKLSVNYDRLKGGLGLSAAKVVAMTPAVGEQKSLIEIFNEMPEGLAKSEFYKAHQSELSKFINKPKAS